VAKCGGGRVENLECFKILGRHNDQEGGAVKANTETQGRKCGSVRKKPRGKPRQH